MAGWKLEDDFVALVADFGSLDAVFALQGQRITKDEISEVIRLERAGVGYYVKRYRSNGKGLRRFSGRTRVMTECRNLKRFAQWGIPTPRVVAAGMQRQKGSFVRGALITRELVGTCDLSQLALTRDPRLANPDWVRNISQQVASITRALHDQHFTHNDLKWRNLLVNTSDQVFLIDCPSGGFWWGPTLRYRIVKDLACLDKVAKTCLSRTQRLRFYLQYRGRQRLNASDKKRIAQVVGFFEGRE
ncbi:Lipopolysaccharide kinase (Kdo/WaaP) family protein [Pseudomonas pohangensis]|jgi:tRNA A-37 threonylcarbamoyl transferase component Bud32|uniref:Lipopolysaccharide kinase (Kdo/WaaP) family protein n=1 Tax=Pseudomonas pohangensis TaxID=364197 RepID=A0A1H2HAS9_9PSED|nr:lipopolysaccharide kinase InaA family protein [Pseudomonas pohangensis]SDU28859.1 Lipopolysaccharide kinase (Kdo/WaaP) family protein [Pseudomonas pohangensis]